MEISEFHRKIAHLSAQPIDGIGSSPVGEALVDSLQKSELATHLQAILDNPKICIRLASESYLHPNGFEKYGLIPLSHLNCRIRLHVWRPENKRHYEDANYHSHVRDFTSVVLAGHLLDRLYTEVPQTDKSDTITLLKYRVHDRLAEGRYIFEDLGFATLQLQSERLLDCGTTYNLPCWQIHRTTIPSDTTTMTIFVQGPEKSSISTVYSATGYKPEKDSGIGSLSVEKYISAIQQALEAVDLLNSKPHFHYFNRMEEK